MSQRLLMIGDFSFKPAHQRLLGSMSSIVRLLRTLIHLTVILISIAALEAVSNAQMAGQVYFFGGPAKVFEFPGVHFGGGGDLLIPRSFGIGGELGILLGGNESFYVLSLNGSRYFVRRSSSNKVIPFVTAGYSTIGGSDNRINAWNIGGGATHWGRNRGFRWELRDHIWTHRSGTEHVVSLRIGLAFR